MTSPDVIRSVIPHQGEMCLLERILDWDEGHIRLATATHRSLENPLRMGGCLRSVHLCEYGTQAMAVHGGLLGRDSSVPRLLVSLRGVHLHVGDIDGLEGELVVEAERLLDTGSSWHYSFRVLHGSRLLAEGRAAVMAATARFPGAMPGRG